MTAGTAPEAIIQSENLLCKYVNLQLVNAKPQECLKGTVGAILLENPAGDTGLTYPGLLHETAKVFGLRSKKLRLCLDDAKAEGITNDSSLKLLNTKTIYIHVLPRTAES